MTNDFKTERILIRIQERIELSTADIDIARAYYLFRVTLNMSREDSQECTYIFSVLHNSVKEQTGTKEDFEILIDFVSDNWEVAKQFKKHKLVEFYTDWRENYSEIYQD
jgi:mRNA-degrading endonuclease YafQ of YafQ-DinJ toxin-antitoxin module